MTTPDKKYDSRTDNSIRLSWTKNSHYLNAEHQSIFETTKDIPGWQMEGDTYKLYEIAYFAGAVILEIGTYGGRSAVVELHGALANFKKPQFFGIDMDINSIKRTFNSLQQFDLAENSLLYQGSLQAFMKEFHIQPTMCFVDGDHLYEGVKKDLDSLSELLCPGIPVLCHDYLNPENDTGEYGIRKAATEWEEEGYATFFGAFGCSALFVTSEKCRGKQAHMDHDMFDHLRETLLKKYGIKPDKKDGTVKRKEVSRVYAGPVDKSDNQMEWLNSLPCEDGLILISKPQRYTFDETNYDEQYNVDLTAIKPGNGLVNMLRETDADFDGPALEIGCGTGLISLGLLKSNAYTTFLFTDPSKEFLNITRNKMQKAMIDLARARFAVLKAEEIDLLPRNVFSLIALRSTLHHVPDYSKFIEDAAMSLKEGGILTFQEPCLDGYVLMGVIAQFIPLVVNGAGAKLSNNHFKQVQSFVDTMKFYARRDLDKSQAEDKHLFRPDEIMKIGVSAGLTVEFLPNITYDYFDVPADMRSDQVSFYDFFRDYLKYCMSFDQALMELIEKHFRNHCDYIEEISSSNSPYMHGVFICRKD